MDNPGTCGLEYPDRVCMTGAILYLSWFAPSLQTDGGGRAVSKEVTTSDVRPQHLHRAMTGSSCNVALRNAGGSGSSSKAGSKRVSRDDRRINPQSADTTLEDHRNCLIRETRRTNMAIAVD